MPWQLSSTRIFQYDNEGVFHQIETKFEEYLGLEESFALLYNTGTNAPYALYYAASFMPGDEVAFPVYTFHATCSPALHFGITSIFCDATNDGNISAYVIACAITPKTKAAVVTDMWGLPCDMDAICSVLKQ